eukprot:TRINITY_DN54_c0_g1_i1.p1 TRINITY_DN54_c0_g1~~TRINITY_DN54_c0_g1_i1.p1  ORF type:complete len:142 (+),score=25.57 TRINITY_DN54_c0_g1_i1:64-489(+)
MALVYQQRSFMAQQEEEEIEKLAEILICLGKRKRKRTRTTPRQLAVLEAIFEQNTTPNNATRRRLSEELGMNPRRIQIWFQNKRAKLKKNSAKKKLNGGLKNTDDRKILPSVNLTSIEMILAGNSSKQQTLPSFSSAAISF